MTNAKIRFEIDCGAHSEVIEAPTPQAAWKIFARGKDQDRLSTMARFREVPWNSKYSWDLKEGRKRKGKFYFVDASWFTRADVKSGPQERPEG